MDDLFRNEDGTIKIIPTTIVVIAIILLLFLIICSLFFKGERKVETKTTTKNITTTTIKLCNGCALKFKQSNFTMNSQDSISVEELLDLTKINIRNVKFEITDKTIAKIKVDETGIFLSTLGKLGKTKVIAKYADIESTLELTVSQDSYDTAKLYDKFYYAYVGEPTTIDVESTPAGIDVSKFKLNVMDSNIAYFDLENKLIPKVTGETKITLDDPEGRTEATLFVIKNRITVKVKENEIFKQMDKYTYTSDLNGYLNLSVKIEDKESLGYNQDSLKIDIVNNGSVSTSVNYENVNLADENSYIYRLNITINPEVKSETNNSIITFSLPDGSKTRLVITK